MDGALSQPLCVTAEMRWRQGSRTFHHVLNRARWSALAVSRQLLTTIVETFVQAGGTLELVIDETLERRWGPKISKRGHYRDSALSSRKRSVSSPGLRWIVMAAVVTLPWTRATMCLALFVRDFPRPRR
ncbi:MAG TPA: transposase [Ktedonobacteraceae bacterium]